MDPYVAPNASRPPGAWRAFWQGLGRSLAAAVFPPRCAGCGAWIDAAPGCCAASLAGLLCPDCRRRVRLIQSPLCRICGRPFDQHPGRDHHCAACLSTPPAFAMARSAAVYAAPLDSLVQRLKYDGRLQTARPLGELLRAAFWRYWADRTPDLIVPVPLHRRRLRARGFNQVQAMLRRWPRAGGRCGPGPVPAVIAPQVLVRRRSTASQAGLDRRARARNVRGAFAVPDPSPIRGRHILLVDDVMTTGATAAACARALAEAGATRIDVLTLARTLCND